MSTITNECSRCGGHGLVHGMEGDPQSCPTCGCAGVVWPPYCSRCGSFGRMGEPCKRCAREGRERVAAEDRAATVRLYGEERVAELEAGALRPDGARLMPEEDRAHCD